MVTGRYKTNLRYITCIFRIYTPTPQCTFRKKCAKWQTAEPVFLCIRTKTKNKSPLSHIHTPTRAVHALEDRSSRGGRPQSRTSLLRSRRGYDPRMDSS